MCVTAAGAGSSLVAEDQLIDAEIRDQVDTLIGAGYDTTAVWTFLVGLGVVVSER